MTVPRFENPPYYITAYGLAVKRGFAGTLDEWIASLHGKQGDKVELRYLDKKIQWRWISSAGDSEGEQAACSLNDWCDLMDVSDIAVENEIVVSDDGDGNVTIETDDRFKESSAFDDLYFALRLMVEDISAQAAHQAEDLEQIKKTVNEGVARLDTGIGLTIEETQINIHRDGFEISSSYDANGVKIVRSEGTDNETTTFEAGADGITAAEARVRDYLVVGTHARFEDYSDGTDTERTACFWI